MDLAGCPYLSDNNLKYISETCLSIEYLNLSQADYINKFSKSKDEPIKFFSLETLILNNMRYLDSINI